MKTREFVDVHNSAEAADLEQHSTKRRPVSWGQKRKEESGGRKRNWKVG